MRYPLIIAHRGSSADAPENTMAAFERAMREHADGIELDVWKCASGEIVVTHDRNLKRITGVEGDVERMTLTELRRLDFGSFKDKEFRFEKIPTLAETLDLVKNIPLINIEIKGKNIRGNGIEVRVIDEIRRFKVFDRSVISSFNPAVLYRVKRIASDVRIGLIFYEGSSLPMRRAWFARWLKPYSLHPSLTLLNGPWVKRARKKNQKVIAWTVNHIHDLEACLRSEVDGIITDSPARMIENVRNLCR
jgi:glycerophosphoryl diester phosphodiesterase